MATRWGFAGAGKITSDFINAMKALPPSEHQLTAVAARSLENAQQFATKFGIQKAYGNYDELANDATVEVVYIGVIHTHHFPIAMQMLNGGKHVICEKPMCVNLKETQQLVQLAREKKLFLMEAVWSRCMPLYQELKRRIDSGEIGDVVQVVAHFCTPLTHVDRVTLRSLGGGSTLDLGIYLVQFALFVMGGEKPLQVLAAGHLNHDGVDENVGSTLVFSKGRLASLSSTIRGGLPSDAFVIGTKGTIKINNPFHAPQSMATPSGLFTSPFPANDRSFNFPSSQGLVYEAAEVRRCLKAGLLESSLLSLDESLLLAEILEQIRKQVGVTYEQD